MSKQIIEINFKGLNFYNRIDIHKKIWSVTIDTDDLHLNNLSRPVDKEVVVCHFVDNYPGANITVGYVAGYFGLELYRYLHNSNENSLVLKPDDIPATHNEKDQNRDPLDNRKFTRALRTGDAKPIPIRVPFVSLELDRQLLLTKKITGKSNFTHFWVLILGYLKNPPSLCHLAMEYRKSSLT